MAQAMHYLPLSMCKSCESVHIFEGIVSMVNEVVADSKQSHQQQRTQASVQIKTQ